MNSCTNISRKTLNPLKLLCLTILTFTLLTCSGIAALHWINVTTNVTWGTQYNLNYSVNVTTKIYVNGTVNGTAFVINYSSSGADAMIWNSSTPTGWKCNNMGTGNGAISDWIRVGCVNTSVITTNATVSTILNITINGTNTGGMMAHVSNGTGSEVTLLSNTSIAFNIDPYQPAIIFLSPQIGYNYSSNFNTSVIVIDQGASFSGPNNNSIFYRMINATDNATPWTIMNNITASYFYTGGLQAFNFSSTFNVASVPDGTYNISINASDVAGNNNVTLDQMVVTIDDTPPVVSLTTPSNLTFWNESSLIQFNYTVTEALSGLANCSLMLNISAATTMSAANVSLSPVQGLNSFTYGLPPGKYLWNVYCNDNLGNLGTAGNVGPAGNQTIYYDAAPPTFSITLNSTPIYNTSAHLSIGVSVTFTDTLTTGITGNLSFVNITLVRQGVFYPCYTNETVRENTVTGTCTFIPNLSGTYNVLAFARDQAFHVATDATTGKINVYNAKPYAQSNGSALIQNTTFAQKRQRYDLMVPVYGGQQNLSLKTGGEWVNPTYYDNATVITSNTMEDLAYNYSFNLNTSNAPNNTIVDFNLTAGGMLPGNVSSMQVYSPDGTIKTVVMMMPDFYGGQFTIYWNGIANSSQGPITPDHPINGTYTMQTGEILLKANVTDNLTKIPITILMSTMPALNITTQTITGFNPSSPPLMGAQVNASFFLNISVANQYYSPANMTITFMFPKNITFNTSSNAGTTTVISSEILLWRWNTTGSVWDLIANSSDLTFQNATLVTVISDTLALSNTPNSPTAGKNVTVVLWGFRYNLDQNRSLGWKYGNSVALNANAVLTFNYSSNVTGDGSAGTSVQANFTINSGVQAGTLIPTSALPGFGPTALISSVILNGQTLSASQYASGSIIINGTSLQQGSNTVAVAYSVAAAQPSTGGTIGGGGGASTSAGQQTITIASMQPGTPTTIGYSDQLLDVRSINLTANVYTTNVKLTVQNLVLAPQNVQAPTGTLYKYMEISVQNLASSQLEKAKIIFRVNKTWFTDNNLDLATTKLNRLVGSAWQTLKTTQTTSDANYYYFEAETPGFSTFAITASAKGTAPLPTVCSSTCPAGQSQKAYPDCSCYTPVQPTQPSGGEVTPAAQNYDWLIYVLVVVVVTALLVFLVVERIKLAKEPKIESVEKKHHK